MGRPKSLSNDGRFVLRKSLGANKKGEYHVYLQYTLDRKQALGVTGVWVKEEDWDETNQKVKQSNSLSARLNGVLKKKKDDVALLKIEFAEKNPGKRITIEILRKMLQGKYDPNEREIIDFVSLVKEVLLLEYKLKKIAYSTYYNSCCYMKNFSKYLERKTGSSVVDVVDITPELVDGYILWRKDERGNANETINKTLTPILKGLKSAVSRDLIKPSVVFSIEAKYLSVQTRLTEEDLEDDAIDYLTLEQLKQLSEIYDSLYFNRTRDYLDMFFFAFHACGLRFSDILTLQWCHIDFQEMILKKIMFKGHNKVLSFRLTQPALEILNRWKLKTGNRVFVFGLLPDDFDLTDEASLDKMRQNKARSIRTSLTEVGKKIGLPFNLRMHVARHSFAVLALDRLRDVYEVSRLLGHRSIEVTQKVYAKFLPETINKDIETKLTFDLTPKTE